METRVLPTDTSETLEKAVAGAVDLLTSGECVALPTETVYGLAADALRSDAVVKIFEAKDRPFFDPLIVHLPAREWLERLTRVESPLVARLIDAFWPGPLTLVLPRRELVPDMVTAGLPTVAVRMSAHPVFRAVATRFGKPLAAPSANRFGRISPTVAEHVHAELGGRIPLIVDGGAARDGIESTIVALDGETIKVLRSGPVTANELAQFGNMQAVVPGVMPQAPGQLTSHYAPRTPLLWWYSGEGRRQEQPIESMEVGFRRGLLAWRTGAPDRFFERVEILSPSGDLREAAATLFAKLRRLDEAGLDFIFAEAVPERGLGVAIMDRLRKAATHE